MDDKRKNGLTDERWTDGLKMDGRIDGQTNCQTKGWTDGVTERMKVHLHVTRIEINSTEA